jgi:hypothetical protein
VSDDHWHTDRWRIWWHESVGVPVREDGNHDQESGRHATRCNGDPTSMTRRQPSCR